jgi:hypothetical protein
MFCKTGGASDLTASNLDTSSTLCGFEPEPASKESASSAYCIPSIWAHNLRRPNAIPIGVGGGWGRNDQSESVACHLNTLPIPSHMPLAWHSGTKVVTSGLSVEGGITYLQYIEQEKFKCWCMLPALKMGIFVTILSPWRKRHQYLNP